jgi:hypothetical protein
MKKLLFALLITLIGVSVQAQNKPLACQDIAVSGLNWENGRWVTSMFRPDKFILVLSGNNLTKESVGKAFNSNTIADISCSNFGTLISCAAFSKQLMFDPKTLKGGISGLFGSAMEDGSYKDSIYVKAFSCQPY